MNNEIMHFNLIKCKLNKCKKKKEKEGEKKDHKSYMIVFTFMSPYKVFAGWGLCFFKSC